MIYCSTYLCIHWLILVCALTRDQTHNLGVSVQCYNQLSYSARTYTCLLLDSDNFFWNFKEMSSTFDCLEEERILIERVQFILKHHMSQVFQHILPPQPFSQTTQNTIDFSFSFLVGTEVSYKQNRNARKFGEMNHHNSQ